MRPRQGPAGLRSRLVGLARVLDRQAGRLAGRRRVLVEARLPVHFVVTRPVVEALLRDPRVDVRVTSDGRPDLARAYEEAGVADRYVTRERAVWMRVDLYLNGDPWFPAPLRRCARRLNFFHGVAGKYDLDQPPCEAGLFDRYDRVAFVNADRMHRYLTGGVIRPAQAALVGYPKLDRLVNGGYDPAASRAATGLDPRRPTVLYAPTWSFASSLHVAGEAIIEALLALDLNVIAKLHDNCFLRGEKYGDVDWPARLERFQPTGRFALLRGADSSPYLAASDVLVTDHSSIGFEFLALDRPLVIFDAPDLPRVARINPEKIAMLRSAADVVTSCAELRDTVHGYLQRPGRLSMERQRVARGVFYGLGSATERAVHLCYELLRLSRPVRGVTRRARLTPTTPGSLASAGNWR